MKDKFLEIKNYIDEIGFYDSQENFEYEHYPYLKNILEGFIPKQQDDFVEEIFNWSDYHLYIISDFLHFSSFKLHGKYDSGYVFCKCFSKINEVEYLKNLAQDLEIQLIFCQNKNNLSSDEIVNNLYLVINNIKDVSWIENYLKIINNITN